MRRASESGIVTGPGPGESPQVICGTGTFSSCSERTMSSCRLDRAIAQTGDERRNISRDLIFSGRRDPGILAALALASALLVAFHSLRGARIRNEPMRRDHVSGGRPRRSTVTRLTHLAGLRRLLPGRRSSEELRRTAFLSTEKESGSTARHDADRAETGPLTDARHGTFFMCERFAATHGGRRTDHRRNSPASIIIQAYWWPGAAISGS